jgi:GDP-D-mannose dehydratase
VSVQTALRGETFVTRKLTRAVARVKLGFQDQLLQAGRRLRHRLERTASHILQR